MKTIVCSKTDIPGMNMYNAFLEKHDFKKTNEEFDQNPIYEKGDFQLVLLNEIQVHAEHLDEIETELFIFASRHTGKLASLSVHPIGNFSKAELGGKDFEVSPTEPFIMKNYLHKLKEYQEQNRPDYLTTLEVTHHGPHLSKPAIYIELGGTPKEWADKEAAEAIANIIVNHTEPTTGRVALGIGDLHYPHYFTKFELESDIAMSHMISKHQVDYLTKEMLDKMIQASPRIDLILVDWKSLNAKQRENTEKILEKKGIEWYKVRRFKY